MITTTVKKIKKNFNKEWLINAKFESKQMSKVYETTLPKTYIDSRLINKADYKWAVSHSDW